MPLNQSFSAELEQESANTKKMLERVPEEHFSWKPHEKSYTLGVLATHIAELPSWVGYTVKADELDFGSMDYKSPVINSSSDLMKLFEENLAQAKEDLKEVSDEDIMKNWSLRNKEQLYFTMPKVVVLRSMVMNHIIHHRAQLGVYLRLLDVPVPGMYGPTADDKQM